MLFNQLFETSRRLMQWLIVLRDLALGRIILRARRVHRAPGLGARRQTLLQLLSRVQRGIRLEELRGFRRPATVREDPVPQLRRAKVSSLRDLGRLCTLELSNRAD